MRRTIIAAVAAALLMTSTAHAGWRGHGHYGHGHRHGGFGAFAGGIIAGAIIAGAVRRHDRPRGYYVAAPPTYPHPYYAQPPGPGVCYSCNQYSPPIYGPME